MTMVVFGVLLAAGVTLLVITAVRVLVGGIASTPDRRPRTQRPSAGSAARRILDERYAAGDLTTEEFQHRLRVLERRD